MRSTKRPTRREKMDQFELCVKAEETRLAELNLSARELIDLFHCGNFFTELAAARLVSRQDRNVVMEEVLVGLTHPRWKVRRTCADFMDHWGDQRCIEPLLQALKDPKEHVRRLALHSLTCQQCKLAPLEGDFLQPLIERALTDRSKRVRHIATGALGNYTDDERAIVALRQILAQDSDPVLLARAKNALDRYESLSGQR